MVQLCQDGDSRPFLEEIKHHLPGDFFGIRTDSFGHDAVIGGKHINSLAQRPARVAFPDRDKSGGDVLKPAETASWFGQMVEMCARLLQECGIRHSNLLDEFRQHLRIDCCHDVFSSVA